MAGVKPNLTRRGRNTAATLLHACGGFFNYQCRRINRGTSHPRARLGRHRRAAQLCSRSASATAARLGSRVPGICERAVWRTYWPAGCPNHGPAGKKRRGHCMTSSGHSVSVSVVCGTDSTHHRINSAVPTHHSLRDKQLHSTSSLFPPLQHGLRTATGQAGGSDLSLVCGSPRI